jgi:CheY-like chemotaxis protein
MLVEIGALVIDDDDELREAIRDVLADEGYAIAEARDGADALAFLRAHGPPSLIVLDWNMAPMNGAQFMDEVAKDAALAEVPVVLLTADARVDDEAKRYAFSACLKKPIELSTLLAMFARYCGSTAG